MAEHRRIHANVHLLHVSHTSYVLVGQTKIQRRSEHINRNVHDLFGFVPLCHRLQSCRNSCFLHLNGCFCCFPHIICFDWHQGNSEYIQRHYPNYLQFIWNFLAQFEAPELQEQLFDRFWPLLVDYLRLGHHVRRTTMPRRSTLELRAIVVRRTWCPRLGRPNIHSSMFQAPNSFTKCGKIRIIQRILEHHQVMFPDTWRVASYGKTRSYTHSGAGKFSNTAVSI